MKKLIIQNPFGEDFVYENLTTKDTFIKSVEVINSQNVLENKISLEDIVEEYGKLDMNFFDEKLEGTGYRIEVLDEDTVNLYKLLSTGKIISINEDIVSRKKYDLDEENSNFTFNTTVYDEEKYGDGEVVWEFDSKDIIQLENIDNSITLNFEEMDSIVIKIIK